MNLAQSRKVAKKKDLQGRSTMTENEIAKIVVDACYHVHIRLGPGLLESVYLRILEYELVKRGLRVRREVPVSFRYDEVEFDEGFRADLIVEDIVILELKSVEATAPVHKKQLLTYLKLTGLKLGLLVNFGAPLIKDGITRLVNGL
jgi:GxxExxY protein